MNYKIYTLNHPVTNEIRYIGYTVESLKERLRCHIKDCNYKNKKSHKVRWIKKLMSEARKKEWAEGTRKATRKGAKNSESHKDKMRGSNNPFFGKTHSDEMRILISERVKAGIAKKKLLTQYLNSSNELRG